MLIYMPANEKQNNAEPSGQPVSGGMEGGRVLSDFLLAEALNRLPMGIFVCDGKWPGFPITQTSGGFTALTHYSVEEAVGRNLRLFLGPGTSVEVISSIQKAIIERKPFQGEVLCCRHDSALVWCELVLTPLSLPDAPARYIAGSLRDITARKHREEQLKDAEANYRGMFENSVDGIYQSTPDGRFITVNPALARMYGYQNPRELLESVSNIQTQIYVDPSFRERFRREIEQSGVVRALEYQVRRRDDSVIWISECAREVRDTSGALRYYEGFISDITLRKEAEADRTRLEKERAQAQKLEAIGTLAGGIAHDFNNMLCVILGYAELSLADKQITGISRRNLDAILKSATRAKDLGRRILTFSRTTEPERKPLKLGPIIKECAKLLNAALPSSVEISHAIQTDDDVVMADPTEIHQVLMNLGTNAMHAMHRHGGRLEYGLRTIELEMTSAAELGLSRGKYVCLSVRDTGHGMTSEILDNIFDPFFTTKPAGEGTGLGLALVQRIVNRCGGHIAVESEIGVGTIFRIYFPRCSEMPVAISSSEPQILSGNREHLLVVDDEISILSMMQQRLRRMGYRVITRADSVAALETFRSEPDKYDLVITDHTMPTMLGAELAEKLAEIRPNIPVVVMTGLNHPPGFADSRHKERRVLVRKPIDFVDLSHRLRGLLEQPVS